jgi:hypothetical protein
VPTATHSRPRTPRTAAVIPRALWGGELRRHYWLQSALRPHASGHPPDGHCAGSLGHPAREQHYSCPATTATSTVPPHPRRTHQPSPPAPHQNKIGLVWPKMCVSSSPAQCTTTEDLNLMPISTVSTQHITVGLRGGGGVSIRLPQIWPTTVAGGVQRASAVDQVSVRRQATPTLSLSPASLLPCVCVCVCVCVFWEF